VVSAHAVIEQPIARLGRYVLFEELARGGMATVHPGRLRGPVGFSKTVAIKKMHPNFALDPRSLAMFLDEARVAGRINHPNVVVVFDVIAELGEAYLVMEYVDGEPLAALSRTLREQGKRIPVPIAAHVVRNALYGLHAAHEATDEQGQPLELVHRDVSPQNILVGTDGVGRVLDFGIAKAVGRLQNSENGQLKGKVAYMAPEQLLGQHVDRRSDVFAAGVVLWEALAGKRLFAAASSAASLYQVLEARIPPLDEIIQDLPPGLAECVARATCKDPRGRYGTALEFARDIENCVPLIPERVVGQWVQDVSGERLESRRARFRAIEALPLDPDTSGGTIITQSTVTASAVRVRTRAQADDITLPEGAEEVTRADRPITISTRSERVHRRAWALALLTLGVAATAGGWWYSARSPRVPMEDKPQHVATDQRPVVAAPSDVPAVTAPTASSAQSNSTGQAALASSAAAAPRKRPVAKPSTNPRAGSSSAAKPKPESLLSRE